MTLGLFHFFDKQPLGSRIVASYTAEEQSRDGGKKKQRWYQREGNPAQKIITLNFEHPLKHMKINILSPGRFHVCDLARELARNGHDVKFYSFVPTSRAMRFGLPKKCSASLFWPMSPVLLLSKKLFPRKQWAARLVMYFQDWLTSVVMRRCDVCIAMSGCFVQAPRKAKRQGAILIIERGSKHILEQKRILDSIPGNNGKITVPYLNIAREIEAYDLADYIAVASQHVVRSMLKYDYPKEKLFLNPYGVDLSMFHPNAAIPKIYDVIMVGNWGYQKGCDLIVEAIKQTNYHFLHVGPLVDLDFPKRDERFTHIDSVDQSKLEEYYHQAKIFVLPSRQEGLAMVQAQAIACNLPLVGSKDSGAEDLKAIVEHPEYITIVEEFTSSSLLQAIKIALDYQKSLNGMHYVGRAAEKLTWKAYGKRYSDFINKITT